MNEDKKIMFQISEIRKGFSFERKALEEIKENIESEVDRFISHIDLLDEKTEEMVNQSKEVLKEVGLEISQTIREDLKKDYVENIERIKKEALEAMQQIKRLTKQNKMKNLYVGLAFFIGVSLTVAAIEYFIPRNQYNVYRLDGKIKHVRTVKKQHIKK